MKSAAAMSVVPLVLAACASGPRTTYERGWVGGRFVDVSRETRFGRHAVVGMPESVPGDAGALVTAAYDGSPLARAGLAPGDLVFSADGAPVEDAEQFREHVESLAPGSTTRLAYWRSGETRAADVVVGRETYESTGRVRIGLGLSSTLDLWPFDDGIDVLGLVRVGKDRERHEVGDPVSVYRRQVDPDADADGPQQEMFEVFVVPIGVAKGKRVVRQETLP